MKGDSINFKKKISAIIVVISILLGAVGAFFGINRYERMKNSNEMQMISEDFGKEPEKNLIRAKLKYGEEYGGDYKEYYFQKGSTTYRNGYCLNKAKPAYLNAEYTSDDIIYHYGVQVEGKEYNYGVYPYIFDTIFDVVNSNNNEFLQYKKKFIVLLERYNPGEDNVKLLKELSKSEMFLLQQELIWVGEDTGISGSSGNIRTLLDAIVNKYKDTNFRNDGVHKYPKGEVGADGNMQVEVLASNVSYSKDNDGKFLVGPINISNPWNALLTIKIEDSNGNIHNQTVNGLVDANGNSIAYTFDNEKNIFYTDYDGEIYLYLNSLEEQNNFKIDVNTYYTDAKYWYDGAQNSQEQVTISKEPVNTSTSISLEYHLGYDVKVVKVNDGGVPVNISENTFTAERSNNENNTQLTKQVSTNTAKFIADEITSTDTVIIEEANAPSSNYEKYDKKIKLTIERQGFNVAITNVKLINSQNVEEDINYNSSTESYDNGKIKIIEKNEEIIITLVDERSVGTYDLMVDKVDSEGNLLPGANFGVKRYNKNFEQVPNVSFTDYANGTFGLSDIAIENSEQVDYFVIDEIDGIPGYAKFNKKVVLKQWFRGDVETTGELFLVDIFELNKNDEFTNEENLTELGRIGNENSMVGGIEPNFSFQDENGNTCTIEIDENNQSIHIAVENNKVDLALKKIITEVKPSNGENYIPVTTNDFNVGRTMGINKSTLQNGDTNALYSMIKTPVDVGIGDEVLYSIKVFNEGEIDAKAKQIKDYIPVGLTPVNVDVEGNDAVKYVNTQNETITLERKDSTTENSYTYDSNSKVLTVNLPEAELIPAYDKTENALSYIEILVKCKVDEGATGVLTNVSEITKYEIATGEIAADIDSTQDNWLSENGEPDSCDKSNDAWRSYATGASSHITDGGEYTDFLAQDEGVNGNKGDDDDFDKVRISPKYTLKINKVSDSNPLSGASFNVTQINRQQSSPNDFVGSWSMVSLSEENAIFKNEGIQSGDTSKSKILVINETNAPNGYVIFDKKVVLNVNYDYEGDISVISVLTFDRNQEVSASELRGVNWYKHLVGNITESQRTINVTDNNENTWVVAYDFENKIITVTAENKPDEIELDKTINIVTSDEGKIYDLALTKTIVYKGTDMAYMYDLDFDGTVNAQDAANFYKIDQVLNAEYREGENNTVYYDLVIGMDGQTQTYSMIVDDAVRAEAKAVSKKFIKKYRKIYSDEKYTDDYFEDTVIKVVNAYRNHVSNKYKYMSAYSIFERYMLLDTDNDGEIDLEYIGDNVLQLAAVGGINSYKNRINSVNPKYLNIFDNNNEQITTADYNLDKTVHPIEKGKALTYKITVYNEGDYDSKDIEIVDYIPDGLIVCDANGDKVTSGTLEYTFNGKTYQWDVLENGKKARYVITDTINKFDDDNKILSHYDVYIPCCVEYESLDGNGNKVYSQTIEDYIENGEIFYDVAEIVDSTAIDDDGNIVYATEEDPTKGTIDIEEAKKIGEEYQKIQDRDSIENSIHDDTSKSNTQDLIDEYEDRFLEEYPSASRFCEKDDYDYEDDDDFERVSLKEGSSTGFDLSLRKSITKVGESPTEMEDVIYTEGNEEVDRLPEINYDSFQKCVEKGTGDYYHKKEAVEVNANDYVEYTIRVYNEGDYDSNSGYAGEITDYIPQDMEFVGIIDADGSYISADSVSAENRKTTDLQNGLGYWSWDYNSETNVLKLTANNAHAIMPKGNLEIVSLIEEDNFITYYQNNTVEFDEFLYDYQEVKIVCRLKENARNNQPLTNIAEITKYVEIDINDNETYPEYDRDSKSGTVSVTNGQYNETSERVNLDTYYTDRNVNDDETKYYPGLQDDDDFETVIIIKKERFI